MTAHSLDCRRLEEFSIIDNVRSLVETFSGYDLAITGGGVTPFEANAQGLPCMIIANEYFEIPNGKLLDALGSSKFISHYKDLTKDNFLEVYNSIDIQNMSSRGMESLTTNALDRIYQEINSVR